MRKCGTTESLIVDKIKAERRQVFGICHSYNTNNIDTVVDITHAVLWRRRFFKSYIYNKC